MNAVINTSTDENADEVRGRGAMNDDEDDDADDEVMSSLSEKDPRELSGDEGEFLMLFSLSPSLIPLFRDVGEGVIPCSLSHS